MKTTLRGSAHWPVGSLKAESGCDYRPCLFAGGGIWREAALYPLLHDRGAGQPTLRPRCPDHGEHMNAGRKGTLGVLSAQHSAGPARAGGQRHMPSTPTARLNTTQLLEGGSERVPDSFGHVSLGNRRRGRLVEVSPVPESSLVPLPNPTALSPGQQHHAGGLPAGVAGLREEELRDHFPRGEGPPTPPWLTLPHCPPHFGA